MHLPSRSATLQSPWNKYTLQRSPLDTTFLVQVVLEYTCHAPEIRHSMIITQSPTAAVSYYTTKSRVYVHRELPLHLEDAATTRQSPPFTRTISAKPPTSLVRMVGHQRSPGTVWVEGAGAVDWREAEAATDDEGVSLGAGVQCREGVADSLHRWGRQGGALADVEVCEPVFHRIPPPTLALHTAVCEGVHGTVRDVLAVVEAQRAQVRTSVGKSNHTLICDEELKRWGLWCSKLTISYKNRPLWCSV